MVQMPKPGKGNRVNRGKAGHRVTPADKETMSRLLKETGNIAEVARRMGWSYQTVYKHMHGQPVNVPNPYDKDYIAEVNLPTPKRWHELTEQEKGWLTDFRAFRAEFCDRETPPFQVEIANMVSTKIHQKLLVLCPPGHGKSQCFSIDYPIWEMLRARAMVGMVVDGRELYKDGWSCMLISKSQPMAQAFLSQIKRTLEQNNKLAATYGRLKPEYPEAWKRDQLTVDGFPVRKEPTFIAAGAGSHIFGWRVHLIIGDDIVDGENSGTPQAAEKLQIWHADELMSRLEPDGVAAMVGTRFSTFDLYGKLWRQKTDDGEPLWHPVLYRAHDDSNCSGEHCEVCKERCVHDKPWPAGCVLWPGRFGYRKLRALRSGGQTSSRFEFIYNQYEYPDEDALVKPEWIEKCKDKERVIWDIPPASRIVCTIDPSPTQWAVAQCWAYRQAEDKRYLVAQFRKRKMQAPEYIALIREWTTLLRQKGVEPLWVVEVNAAQRWLLQSTEYQMMRAEMGVSVIPHTTGRNKADPVLGIGSLGPAYEFQKVSLPWGDPTAMREVQPLIEELISYPTSETDDTIMAQWFFEFNIRRAQQPIDGQFLETPNMPPFLMERRGVTDLRIQKWTPLTEPSIM